MLSTKLTRFTTVLLVALVLTGCTTFPRPVTPQIYDVKADGEQQLNAALSQAGRERKRVLLNLGANWCSDSQAMFQLFHTDPEIRRVIEDYYVFEMIDVNQRGLRSRNAKLVARFGDPLAAGIPALLVLDANGVLLNRDPSERLSDSDHRHPAIVLAYFRKWSGQQ